MSATNVRDRLFTTPDAPPPPPRYAECALEWRLGWEMGWEATPGGESTNPTARRSLGVMGGLRGAARRDAGKLAREARKAIIAEVWPIAQREGREHAQHVNNWPRKGVAYGGVFFFRFGTMKLPSVVKEG